MDSRCGNSSSFRNEQDRSELFEEYKEDQLLRWFKVAFPKNGGTAKWKECYGHLRNVHEKRDDAKVAKCAGSLIPVEAKFSYKPN